MTIKIINGSTTSTMEFTDEKVFNEMTTAIDAVIEKQLEKIKL